MSNFLDEKPFLENTDVVQSLRVKTEEEDMKAYLKTSFGGYTKQSVLDYINTIKKNQQAMSDTFNKNLDSLMADKEKLKKFNEMLQLQLNKVEREYESLSESMLAIKLENEEYSSKHIPLLRESIQALEKELSSYKQEALQKATTLESLERANHDLSGSLEELRAEAERELRIYLQEKEEAENQCSYFKSINISLEDRIAALTEELTKEKELLRTTSTESDGKEGLISSLYDKINALQSELDSNKTGRSFLEHKLYDLEKNNNKLLLQQEEIHKQLEAKEAIIKQQGSEARAKEESIELTNQEIINLEEELKRANNLELAMEYKISELSKANKELTCKAEELKALLEIEKEKLLDSQNLLEQEAMLKGQVIHLEHKANKLNQELNQQNELLTMKGEELKEREALIANLTEKIELLEQQLKNNIEQQNSLGYRIEELEKEKESLVSELQKAREDIEGKNKQLWNESFEAKKQMKNAAKLAEQLEQQEHELQYWKELYKEDKSEELEWKIKELTLQLEGQSDIISKHQDEEAIREEAMEALNQEILSLKQEIASIMDSMDSINLQKEKLIAVNNQLGERLRELFRSTIELIKEKSELAVDKGIANKKLSEALSKVSMLELQLNKVSENIEESKINNVIYRKFVD